MNPSATSPSSASNTASSSSGSWFSGLVISRSGKPNASNSSFVRIAQTNPVAGELCGVLLKYGPKSTQMMKKRHKVERELSAGDEVGWSKNVEVAKSNPKLTSMNKKFRMIHGLSSLAIILSFGCLAVHSWFLAGKINLLTSYFHLLHFQHSDWEMNVFQRREIKVLSDSITTYGIHGACSSRPDVTAITLVL